MHYDGDDDELHPPPPRPALSSSPQHTWALGPSPSSRRLPAPMLPVLLGDDGSNTPTNHTSSTRSRVDSIHGQRKISLVTAAIAATAATAATTLPANNSNSNNNPIPTAATSSRSPVVRTASPKAHRSLSPYQLPPIVVGGGGGSNNSTIIAHRQHSGQPPRQSTENTGRTAFGSSSPPTLDKRPPPLTTGSGSSGSSSSRHNPHYLHYDNNHQQQHHQQHQQHQQRHPNQQHQDLHLPPIKAPIASNHQLPPLTQIFSASSPTSHPAQKHTNPIHLPPIITHGQVVHQHHQQRTPNGLTSPTHHRQSIVHPPLQHPPRPPPVRPVRSTSPPEIPPSPVKPSLLPPSQIPPPPPMPPPRPPLVAVPKLPPRHNTEPDPETLSQVLQETRAKLLAENAKAPLDVLRTVRAILDSPAWELNGHPQAAFVQPPHGPSPSSNCGSVNANANESGSNTNTTATATASTNGIVPPPATIEEISVEALQPLFKAIPYTSKGGKEGSRGGTDKYECLWGGCGKIVKRRDHMVNHVKAHLGIKPFACPFVYEYLDQRQCWMRFLRIDDLKRHVRSVHKCDLTEDGGLKPREPKPGEAMHPSTSTHAGSLLEARVPMTPSGSTTVAATAAPNTIASVNPCAPGPRVPPIVTPPNAVPHPSWRPSSGVSGGSIATPDVSCTRGRERDGRSVAGVLPVEREGPMSAGSARSGSYGMLYSSLRGETPPTPPSPMDTREDD